MTTKLLENKEKDIFLDKISNVLDFVLSTEIPSIDKSVANIDNLFTKLKFHTSVELWADIQNIPRWWRIVYNWGVDIHLSLVWASGWMKLLDEKKQMFTKEIGKTDFIEFGKSEYFDDIAWTSTKYYLDNAIIRLHSYREKLAWLLNSHSKLCLIPEKDKLSFWKYWKYYNEINNLEKEFQAIADILSKYFISKEVNDITEYYRHNFIHKETPSVDWPKEKQATIKKLYDKEKLISMMVPFYGLQPPDFEIDSLLKDALYVWKQFVEGTNLIAGFLKESYYEKNDN